ncbi:MAG: CAP domain-containing protein [Myxococcales bacterium]|nr:CAP domain-containing protein [Myxococcales bacterium]
MTGRLGWAVLAAVLVSACGGEETKGGTSETCGAEDGSDVCEVFGIVNEERAGMDLPAYAWNAELAQAAQLHAEDMVDQGYFDHTSLDGRDFSARAKDAGYDAFPSGENIAQGQKTPAQVMDSWMGSSGHRANILSADHSEIGVGLDGVTWVQVFGQR